VWVVADLTEAEVTQRVFALFNLRNGEEFASRLEVVDQERLANSSDLTPLDSDV
jgi:hypothetical protein